tara:strand:+ start:13435 stop:14430 length:996 start_codon:yes stop_codon:yes gene_type:complete
MNYFNLPGISNSSLSTFNYDPSLYYKMYITKEVVKKESDAMTLGSLIHCLILEPEKLEERYIVSNLEEKDYPSVMMLDYINTLTQSDIQDEVAYEAAYQKSGYKISREKVRENFEKPANQAYYKELLASTGKTLIKQSDFDIAAMAVSKAEGNPQWDNILPEFDSWQCHNELEIFWDETIEKEVVQLKSKLDQIFVKCVGDTVHVKYIDYKTDSKNPVHKYLDTFDYYKTYRQMYFYKKALISWLKDFYPDFTNYNIQFYICAIDVVRIKSLIYFIDRSYILKGQEEVERDLSSIIWHHKENKWEYPKTIYDSLELNGNLTLIDKDFYLHV